MDNNGLNTAPQPASPPPPQLPPSLPATPPAFSVPAGGAGPARRTGRFWMVAALVLFCVLAGSLLLNFLSVFSGMGGAAAMHGGGLNLVEMVLEDNDSADKIAVINVEGIISGGDGSASLDMVRLIKAQFKRAAEDKHVKAVVLRIDSPGGEVLAAESISEQIKQFQQTAKKPVVASMGSLAASGGYYVAAPCRWIVAHELTITGSIGVIMHGYNYRGLMNKIGLRPEVYKSGKFKDMLSGDKDLDAMTPEEKALYRQEREMVQTLIDEAYDTFKRRVKDGRESAARQNRATNLGKSWEQYADGRIFSGKQALDYGFVDQNGTMEDAVKHAAKLTGIAQANLVTYGIPFDFSNLFGLLGKAEPPAVKLDMGVSLPPLKTGRLYYLSPVLPQ